MAKAFPNSKLTGIDYWGGNWEYSKVKCQHNARIEGVFDRIDFLKASASNLPFKDEDFDLVVGCLTFHEVEDTPNKIDVIQDIKSVKIRRAIYLFRFIFGRKNIWK